MTKTNEPEVTDSLDVSKNKSTELLTFLDRRFETFEKLVLGTAEQIEENHRLVDQAEVQHE